MRPCLPGGIVLFIDGMLGHGAHLAGILGIRSRTISRTTGTAKTLFADKSRNDINGCNTYDRIDKNTIPRHDISPFPRS